MLFWFNSKVSQNVRIHWLPYKQIHQNTGGHSVDTAEGQAIILQSQCEISNVPLYTGLTEM